MMPKKIIEEIKAAEERAQEIRKGSDTEIKAIIENALKEADRIYADTVKETESECERKIAEAKKVAEARIDENRRMSYENAAKMTEAAKKKTEKAVSVITESILRG